MNEPYNFKRTITDPDHFVNRYIDYASQRTSAPWDYHEALALILLANVTRGLKWDLPSNPGGLRTNLFVILYGRSGTSMKSTAMKIAAQLLRLTLPGAELSSSFTPGALEEQMAERRNATSMVWFDEFTRTLDLMHHQSFMAGLRGFLLTMYGEEDYTYRRTSKGHGKKKEAGRGVDHREPPQLGGERDTRR